MVSEDSWFLKIHLISNYNEACKCSQSLLRAPICPSNITGLSHFCALLSLSDFNSQKATPPTHTHPINESTLLVIAEELKWPLRAALPQPWQHLSLHFRSIFIMKMILRLQIDWLRRSNYRDFIQKQGLWNLWQSDATQIEEQVFAGNVRESPLQYRSSPPVCAVTRWCPHVIG